MQIKYVKTLLEPQNGENPICALAWSPNNKKLAVATTDRKVLLFDDAGVQRDKFSTKPSDPAAGKKSYSITCLMFSSQSDMVAVGQSDNIVFVYRVGEGWESKKVICNKFPLSSSCTSLLFISHSTLLCGQMDGKTRMLDCKTNKGTSAWNGSSACIAISSFSNGLVISGHVDGALLTTGGRLLARHPVPPTAMCALDNAVLAAGCDRRIVIYDNTGRPISSFNLSRDSNQQEFTVACGSPSGQAAFVGSYDCCHLVEWSVEKRKWSLGRTIIIPGLYSVQGVAWSADGAKIAIGGYTGATLLYEAMLRRWIYRGVVEAIRRGQGQVTLNRLTGGVSPYTIQANIGKDIHSIRILGDDWYAVCRTESSLIVCDLARSLSSEVQWSGSGEKFFFQHTPVCLVHRAGELTLIEYGIDSILASVRTEYTNPHLISVRINEGQNFSGKDNKKLAYLLDQKSVSIVDLVTGSQVAQCRLESRVDWLELSESAHVLLLRDRRRRLLMMDVSTGKMEVILSGVSFVQWVEGSDAVVAQTSTHLAVWYSIEEVGLVELVECGGGEAVRVEGTGNPRVIMQGGSLAVIPLDHARLHFCTSLRSGDFSGCESYLITLSDAPQATMLWQQLANKAMEIGDMKMAVRCWRALGDEAKSAYLARTLVFAEEYAMENTDANGMEAPKVRARLAILSYDLKTAEQIYLEELKNPELAITMYRNLHRWPEAISVAERLGLSEAHSLREHYMNHLITTGGEAEAASILMNKGDSRAALQLLLKAGLAGHAARTLKDSPSLLTDRDTVHSVLRALFKNECWEQAAELCESSGDQNQAVKLYAKANSYAKAIQRARLVAPNEVRDLEQAWGEWLMGRRQYGAAVAHLIEAGDSKAALAAAVKAQQWAKALQIIQVIDDIDSIREYYQTLAYHYVSVQDWDTAEALWEAGGLVEDGARKLGEAGQGVRGLSLARRLLGSQAAVNIFQPLADKYKEQGKYKEAELLYIGMGMSEAAMTMYEETGRHAALLRVVAEHRPALLAAATRRVAQQLHHAGRFKQAEQYYVQADDWKSAIQMYRAADQWEDAYRVAQNHASPQIQEQVLVAWSNWVEDPADAARILQARGGVEAGVRWAARGGRWARALDLCKAGAPHLEAAVRAQMAAHLEDQGKLEEAEEEFIKGGGASEAVDMWIHAQQYARALALSEKHAPEKEQEVLREYAKWAEEQGDITLYEALIIRAGQPQEIIRHYKENGMWSDAIRVCEEYLPQAVRALKMEAARNGGLTDGGDTDDQESADPETILRTAAQHANNGEYLEAIQGLLSLSVEVVGSGTVERATLRAARLARDHLSGREAKQVAPLIAQRLTEAGQEEMGIRLQNALLNMHSDADSQDYTNVSAESGSNRADQLAKRGEWAAAIETATAAGPAAATRIAIRWAATLLQHPDTLNYQNRDGSLIGGVCAAIHVLSHWANSAPGPPPSLAPPLLARASALNKAPFSVLRDLRNILHTILINCNGEAEGMVLRGVEAAALLCIREACRHTAPLKPLALRSATALLRHTDIIAADNAFYEAGMLLRESEREGEALVMLNRYLDLAEAADADSGDTTLDHADFGETDFPQEVVLGGNTLSAQEHDEVREWVLAVSLDQSVTQALPVDKRGLYECCLGPGDAACVLTGYPLSTRLVNFTNGRSANRDAWAKIVLHCSTEPTSDAADCRRFLTAWCGADDYTLT